MGKVVHINLVDSDFRGGGRIHSKLLKTTYKYYLTTLDYTKIGSAHLKESVITSIYKKSGKKPSVDDVVFALKQVSTVCVANKIKRVTLGVNMLFKDSFDQELITMMCNKAFDRDIEVILV